MLMLDMARAKLILGMCTVVVVIVVMMVELMMLVWLILMVVMMLTGDDDSKFDCGDDIDSGEVTIKMIVMLTQILVMMLWH